MVFICAYVYVIPPRQCWYCRDMIRPLQYWLAAGIRVRDTSNQYWLALGLRVHNTENQYCLALGLRIGTYDSGEEERVHDVHVVGCHHTLSQYRTSRCICSLSTGLRVAYALSVPHFALHTLTQYRTSRRPRA
eukprot:3137939-Rhodomonas_salina.1